MRLSVSARRADEPCWITSSSSGMSEAAGIPSITGSEPLLESERETPLANLGKESEGKVSYLIVNGRPCARTENRYIAAIQLLDIS